MVVFMCLLLLKSLKSLKMPLVDIGIMLLAI
jgi:hypothetical protein